MAQAQPRQPLGFRVQPAAAPLPFLGRNTNQKLAAFGYVSQALWLDAVLALRSQPGHQADAPGEAALMLRAQAKF